MALTVSVNPARGKIYGSIPPGVNERLRAVCSYERVDAAYIARAVDKKIKEAGGGYNWARSPNFDTKVSLYDRGARTFPTGLLDRVEEVLRDREVPYQIEREWPDIARVRSIQLPDPNPNYALREYQRDAVRAVLPWDRRMIRMATGGGKTVVAGHLIHQLGHRACFLVHTKDLLYQAAAAFEDMFGVQVGVIGDGNVKIGDITVATLQTMARALGVTVSHNTFEEENDTWNDEGTRFSRAQALSYVDSVGTVFMDECHRVAAPMAEGVVLHFKNALRRYGLSASPWRDDGADIVLEGVFGAVGPSISASELIRSGYLVRPYIRMRYVTPVAYGRDAKYSEVYDEYVVENEERNHLGMESARSMVERGRPTLVLVRRIAHGDAIARQLTERLGFSVPFLSGADAGLLRRDVMDDVRCGRLGCVVATTIADEGLDVKPLSGLVLLGGGKSSTRALQRIGRVLRPWESKRDAEVTDFDDNARFLATHTIAREKLYATEPEYTVLD